MKSPSVLQEPLFYESTDLNTEPTIDLQNPVELLLHCEWWNHAAAQSDWQQHSETRTLSPNHLRQSQKLTSDRRSEATFLKLVRKIFGRFLFLGKDAHFQNSFGKHLSKILLVRYSERTCILETSLERPLEKFREISRKALTLSYKRKPRNNNEIFFTKVCIVGI